MEHKDSLLCRKRNQYKQSMKVSFTFTELIRLRKCITKSKLLAFIRSIDEKWKRIFQYYLADRIVTDIYSRKLNNRLAILSSREFFYHCFDDPEILELDSHMKNSVLRKLTYGMANYIEKNYDEMEKFSTQ